MNHASLIIRRPVPAALAFAALAISALAVSAPLAAQNTSEHPISAAFDRGKNSGLSPATHSEFLSCAAHWQIWTSFVSEFPPTGDLASALPAAILMPQAGMTATAWEMYVDEAALDLRELESSADQAAETMMEGFEGDERKMQSFFETLGGCVLE